MSDTPAELSVVPYGIGWLVVCSIHGSPGPLWTSQGLAGYDAIGHGTTHHTQPFPHVTIPGIDTAARPWPADAFDQEPQFIEQFTSYVHRQVRLRHALIEWVLGEFFCRHPGLFFQVLASRP
jgi:hypothetical protein